MKLQTIFPFLLGIVFLLQVNNVQATYQPNVTDALCGIYTSCGDCIDAVGCGWCYNERQCQNQKDSCPSALIYDKCPSFFNKDLAIGTVLIFIGGILTSGGGVGGGGVYIPILVLILRFSPHVAVPLSKITIFGIAVGGFIILSRKRHPKANRPLIDFDTAFMMEPMTLLGSILGVYMNIVFPTYLLIVFLVLVLGYNAYKTLGKGFTLYKQEKKAAELQALGPAAALIEEPNLDEENHELNTIMSAESRIPWWQMGVLAILEIGMLVFLYLKGGAGKGDIGIVECGTAGYWLLVLATIPYLSAFTYFAGRYLRKKHARKVATHFRFLKEDIQWTYKRTVVLPLLFVIAGVAAGFLGIGAGLVVGPIFLEMGMVPQVAVATSSYMILYTSFATTVQFLILGRLPWEDAVWYFFVGVFAAMIGQYGLSEFIRRYKKQAFINFLLGGIIGLSVISMAVLEAISVAGDVKEHRSMGFNGVCSGKA